MKVITEPSREPVQLSEVKSYLGITDDDDSQDDVILGHIKAARKKVESYLNRSLITQTLEIAFKDWPDNLYLDQMPVQSITSIIYTDDDGTDQTLSTAYYSLDDYSVRHKVYLNYSYDWPSARDVENSIKVRYVAGYGTTGASVPDDILQAMMIIIGNWVRYQASAESGLPISTIPYAAKELLQEYRVITF